MKAIQGTWADAPKGFVLLNIVAHEQRALLGGRVLERPELWWVDGSLAYAAFHPIPTPPGMDKDWGALDIGEVEPELAIDGNTLAMTRVEYQGGSFGLVVFPDLAQSGVQEILSPTDSDLGFGQPLVVRGAEIFTQEGAGGPSDLWHYRRSGTSWKGQHIVLPEGLELDWALALSEDGQRLAVAATREEKDTIEVFEREGTGEFSFARTLAVPEAPAPEFHFFRGNLVVGYSSPGMGDLTIVDPVSGEVLSQIAVPPEGNGGSVRAVSGLTVNDGLALVRQSTGVVVVDLASGRVACQLVVPQDSDGAAPYPIAAATKRQIFVGTRAGRVGVFERDDCGLG